MENDIEKLTLGEFMELVKQMRFNQRRFKKSTSKREQIAVTMEPLENKVDELISLYSNKQQKLF